MKISIAAKHIKRGLRKSSSQCPVALAMREATGKNWLVGALVARLVEEQPDIPLPEKAKDWIAHWDAGKKRRPFSFEMDLEGAAR